MKLVEDKDVNFGDIVWLRAMVSGLTIDCSSYHEGDKFKFKFEPFKDVYEDEPKDNWIPFNKEECKSLDDKILLLVQYEDTSSEVVTANWLNRGSFYTDSIVAYKIITPYTPPREKIIFKNKKEMLTELISRGKLYLNEEGEEHVYFSEDDRYTLGYVTEDGRSEVADKILDLLEFWVDQ